MQRSQDLLSILLKTGSDGDKIQAHVDPQLEYDLYGAAVGVTLCYRALTISGLSLVKSMNEAC